MFRGGDQLSQLINLLVSTFPLFLLSLFLHVIHITLLLLCMLLSLGRGALHYLCEEAGKIDISSQIFVTFSNTTLHCDRK